MLSFSIVSRDPPKTLVARKLKKIEKNPLRNRTGTASVVHLLFPLFGESVAETDSRLVRRFLIISECPAPC